MRKKKVLITYATYGSGHKTVASYIYEYFKKNEEFEVKIIDLMDYENIIGLLSKKIYEQNFKYRASTRVFDVFYELFDLKSTTLGYKFITKSVFKNKKLQNDIIEYNPDLLITTHFFGNILLGMLNKKKLTHAKILSIITDYTVHELCLKDKESIDALIVSNEMLKNDLVVNKKIDKSKIYAYGIPISEKFNSIGNCEKIKEKYHVNNGKEIVLFFAGGSSGSSFSYKYLKKILEDENDINLIYVCGKNKKIKEKTEELIKKHNYKNVYPIGFSNEINLLLSVADIVITKPGGITITEVMEMKKPMLLIPGNGGQEKYNAKFVCKNGFGINCKNPRKLSKTLTKVLTRKNIMLNMKRKLNNYSENSSIEKIYKLSKKLLK